MVKPLQKIKAKPKKHHPGRYLDPCTFKCIHMRNKFGSKLGICGYSLSSQPTTPKS